MITQVIATLAIIIASVALAFALLSIHIQREIHCKLLLIESALRKLMAAKKEEPT